MSGTLYIVATPIGNLEDLTPRARETLAAVDLIAAEDTRHTGRLLSHIGVKTPQTALHDHNEADAADALVEQLIAGKNIALVSDAGTPLVSDPGYKLVRAAHARGLQVVPVPGASALLAALSAAGLPTDRFCFEGFLPAKKAQRRARLAELAAEPRSQVYYESVHRIAETLSDMTAAFGDERAAFIGRELTKLHEQCVSGTLATIAAQLGNGDIVAKGEFVLVVAGNTATAPAAIDSERLLRELAAVLPAKEAARIAAAVTGERRNSLYAKLLEFK